VFCNLVFLKISCQVEQKDVFSVQIANDLPFKLPKLSFDAETAAATTPIFIS
jgi:hypothetical protein